MGEDVAHRMSSVAKTYRIEGGDPDGIMSLPGPEGCRIRSIKTRINIMQGKSRTTPRGTEIGELRMMRIGRRKNAIFNGKRRLVFEKSFILGSFFVEGILLMRF
jgi:hypothetical protein